MNDPNDTDRSGDRWARLRFAVVAPLLASPPPAGALHRAFEELAAKTWKHPVTDEPIAFAVASIERWFYLARSHPQDPVGALRRRPRKDLGVFPSLKLKLRQALWAQYKAHPNWRCQLHVDNLAALVDHDPSLGPMPSYPTVRRYMRAQGMVRRPLVRDTEGGRAAVARLDDREVRSYECPYVGGLWHLDFHRGSLAILTAIGAWIFPVILAILDDCSRLACHVQWYLEETTETLLHGLSQAMQKRPLPRALMNDNGSPMIAAETEAGLEDLGVSHELTLPYSPYQNGKQEAFWATLEGRLMRMLEGEKDLSLAQLNEATQAWVEMEYNRRVHSELGESPLERYLRGPSVGRESPTTERLRQVFRMKAGRKQRRSDGTISLEGRRFEIPSQYRHLERICVRYARWDLGYVHMQDPRTRQLLGRLYPQDKQANATGERKKLAPIAGADPLICPAEVVGQQGRAPLLAKLLTDYAATGFPAAYLPHHPSSDSAATSATKAHPTPTREDEEEEEA